MICERKSGLISIFTPARRHAVVGVWLFTIVVVFGAPLIGWPPTLRGSVVFGVPLLLTGLFAKPWTWRVLEWRHVSTFEPTSRHVAIGATVAGVLLAWIV